MDTLNTIKISIKLFTKIMPMTVRQMSNSQINIFDSCEYEKIVKSL